MLPDYDDIRALTDREPEWYNEQGVPRYRTFTPDMLGIYDKYAVLVEIGCQGCDEVFLVGVGQPAFDLFPSIKQNSLEQLTNRFHYGDPPRHACVGDTMNCIDLKIVEAWQRPRLDWERVPEQEIEIQDLEVR